jgi:uncharacterized protein YraI
VQARYNANVRRGPGENYEAIDVFYEGSSAEVLGRYDHPATGVWWFIDRIGEGLNGWVWGGAVLFSGNPASVPYFEAPPTSTPSPEPTQAPPSTLAPSETPAPSATPTS